MRMLWLVALGVATSWGCTHQRPFEIVAARELAEAAAAPFVSRVEELGGADVAASGAILPMAGDGVAVVGEGLWLRGRNFGRQPTVMIGGLAAPVLARTADAGIVVRVPTGVIEGASVLTVSTLLGRVDVPLHLRRYVVVGDGLGALEWFVAAGEAASLEPHKASPSLPAASRLVFSSDGRAAYTLEAKARRLAVIDVAAQHGPALGYILELEGKPVRFVEAAAEAPVLVLLRSDDVLVLSTVTAARPPRSRPRALPVEVMRETVGALAVSPHGDLFALALPKRNEVVVLSLQDRNAARVAATFALDASAQAPHIKSLGFATGGRSLWVLAGCHPESGGEAAVPTRLHSFDLVGDDRHVRLIMRATHDVTAAGAPTALAVSRTRPLPSGAAIRVPPSSAQVLLAAEGPSGAAGTIFGMGAGGVQQALPLAGVATDLVIEPLGRWAYATVYARDGATSLLAIHADARGTKTPTSPLWPGAGARGAWVEVQP